MERRNALDEGEKQHQQKHSQEAKSDLVHHGWRAPWKNRAGSRKTTKPLCKRLGYISIVSKAEVDGTLFAVRESLTEILSNEQPCDVPDLGLLWTGWGENDRGVSFVFGADIGPVEARKCDFGSTSKREGELVDETSSTKSAVRPLCH